MCCKINPNPDPKTSANPLFFSYPHLFIFMLALKKKHSKNKRTQKAKESKWRVDRGDEVIIKRA